VKKASPFLLALVLLLSAVPAFAQPVPPPAGTVPLGPYDELPEELEEAEVLMGDKVPTYFVVSAFLRRAAIVLDRPPEQRPDLFAEFGCAPGQPAFEKCQKLVKEAAAVHTRPKVGTGPEASQASLDGKGKDIGLLYAELLNLLTKTPEQAAAFHRKVDEVRLTVGVGLSDIPGEDQLSAARHFDQSLKAAYQQAASLPGYVAAPPAEAPEGSAKQGG
jgi:hypothetical protein